MCLYFKHRRIQKTGGHLKVIFEPYMVKMGCFWSFFAQSQQKKRCLPAIPPSFMYVSMYLKRKHLPVQ